MTPGNECVQADQVIESAGEHRWAQEEDALPELLKITSRMLQRPGLQREVVAAMIEDTEVRYHTERTCLFLP